MADPLTSAFQRPERRRWPGPARRRPGTLVAFKGGTTLRKAYAGAGGRFSTDLDFSVATLDDHPVSGTQLLVGEIDDTRLGRFTHDSEDRRGRHTIIYRSEIGPDPTGQLQSKVDKDTTLGQMILCDVDDRGVATLRRLGRRVAQDVALGQPDIVGTVHARQ